MLLLSSRSPTTYSEAKQSIKEGRDSQLLLPVADLEAHLKKKRQIRTSQFLSKHQKEQGEKITLKGTTGTARLHGFARKK
jgi:hypothetical protein